MFLVVAEGFDDLEEVQFFCAFDGVQAFSELELVGGDGFVDEVFPAFVVDDFYVVFLFDVCTAVLNVFLVGVNLCQDEFDVRLGGLKEGVVLVTLDELVKVGC